MRHLDPALAPGDVRPALRADALYLPFEI